MSNTDLNGKTRDELRVIAKDLEIEGRGQMRKPQLIAAIEEARRLDAVAEETRVVPNRAELRARGLFRNRAKAKPVVLGKVMPLHHRGRAIGAKHLNLRVAAGRSNEEFLALTVPSVS